jgi:hypothetical protein
MQRLKLVQAALLALPLVALACGPQRADTREPAGEPATSAPAATGAARVELGSTVGDDGRLVGHADTFKRGEPIIAALDASTFKAGTAVRMTWMGPSGQMIANDEIMVPPDARVITFKAQDTTSWTPGQYRVDVDAAGALVSKTVTVE